METAKWILGGAMALGIGALLVRRSWYKAAAAKWWALPKSARVAVAAVFVVGIAAFGFAYKYAPR